MSWEGYTQRLCKNGHLLSSTDYIDEAEPCLVCGAGQVWWNQVDLTNGSYDDDGNRIDGGVELEETDESKLERCKCNKCGNVHRPNLSGYGVSAARYKIPEKGGHKC